jgi:hypothetical protein
MWESWSLQMKKRYKKMEAQEPPPPSLSPALCPSPLVTTNTNTHTHINTTSNTVSSPSIPPSSPRQEETDSALGLSHNKNTTENTTNKSKNSETGNSSSEIRTDGSISTFSSPLSSTPTLSLSSSHTTHTDNTDSDSIIDITSIMQLASKGKFQGVDESKTGDRGIDRIGTSDDDGEELVRGTGGEEVVDKSFGWGDVHRTADNSDDDEHPIFTVNPMGDREKDRQVTNTGSGPGSASHTPSYTPPLSGTHSGSHTPSCAGTHTPPTPTDDIIDEDTPIFMVNPLRSGSARLPPKQEKRRRSENFHEFRITDVTLKGTGTGAGMGMGMGEVPTSKAKEKLVSEDIS